jgi:hypothetical protein
MFGTRETAAYWAVRGYWTAKPDGFVDVVRQHLAGKDLACWCPLVDSEGRPVSCHADVLLRLANEGAPSAA